MVRGWCWIPLPWRAQSRPQLRVFPSKGLAAWDAGEFSDDMAVHFASIDMSMLICRTSRRTRACVSTRVHHASLVHKALLHTALPCPYSAPSRPPTYPTPLPSAPYPLSLVPGNGEVQDVQVARRGQAQEGARRGIKNGRLAMIGFMGLYAQAMIPGLGRCRSSRCLRMLARE